MRRVKKIENIVYEILVKYPETRSDDFKLIAEYYYKVSPEVGRLNFNEVFLGHKELGLTNFKTIERCRRKVQAMHPELFSDAIKEKRRKLAEEHKEYYANYELEA